jgi:hypothetical protein
MVCLQNSAQLTRQTKSKKLAPQNTVEQFLNKIYGTKELENIIRFDDVYL